MTGFLKKLNINRHQLKEERCWKSWPKQHMELKNLSFQALGVKIGLKPYITFLARTGIYLYSCVGFISFLMMVIPIFQM